MQKRFSATTVATLLLVMGAGVLITAHLGMVNTEGWVVPPWLLWGVEGLAYVIALLFWRPGAKVAGFVGGVLAMFLLRLAVGGGAAAIDYCTNPSHDIAATFSNAVAELLPRGCSIVFALMSFYPLRSLLPVRAKSVPSNLTQEKEAAAGLLMPSATPAAGTFLFGAPTANAAGATTTPPRPDVAHQGAQSNLPAHLAEAQIVIPLRSVAAQLPAGMLREDIVERIFQEPLSFSLPLGMIAPQLKEAQIQIPVTSLPTMLPKGWADLAAVGADDKLTLPLEEVIPQVPDEVFALPPVTPPAWMNALQEEEKVLFAQV